jgi:aminomethyltransferase
MLMQQTHLYQAHTQSNAKMVTFFDWQMPLHYGSQIKEHEAVRTNCGMFDVSHMLITDISGSDAKVFLRTLLSNDVAKLDKYDYSKAIYSVMLTDAAGVIDDLLVYSLPFSSMEDCVQKSGCNDICNYRIVTNAATAAKDIAWIKEHAKHFDVILNERRDLSIIAIQGPNAIEKVLQINPNLNTKLNNCKPFAAIKDNDWFFARTGYTGEDGLEIMLPNSHALRLWQALLNIGVQPCGLAARDTLRIEAGMNLYGHDMDEAINPLECNMEFVVDLTDTTRKFIGKNAYLKLKSDGNLFKQVGLIIEDGKGIMREGCKLIADDQQIGVITSGTFSPILKKSIAIARLKTNISNNIYVDIRGNLEKVKLVSLPFVRNGKQVLSQ